MTFGTKLKVAALLADFDDGVGDALQLGAEHVLTEANKRVPHETGELERSGVASSDAGQGRAAVSYDTPYAVVQHEAMDYRHDGKGEAKWLENTMTREVSMVGQIVAQAIRSRIGG